MVRAKFVVSKVAKNYWNKEEQPTVEVMLTPQYDDTIPEDRRYAKATPSGEMRLWIDNPSAVAYLKPGRAFYVDFTDCEEGQTE